MHLLRKRIPFGCFLAGVWLFACGSFEGRTGSPAAVLKGSGGSPAAVLRGRGSLPVAVLRGRGSSPVAVLFGGEACLGLWGELFILER
jgi:hypothetical protein